LDIKVRQRTLRKLSNGIYVLTSRCTDRYGAATITWVETASQTTTTARLSGNWFIVQANGYDFAFDVSLW